MSDLDPIKRPGGGEATPAIKGGFLTPRWILATLLVLAAMGVMVRLGFWQLDRLAEKRAFNARVKAQIDAPPLDLNNNMPADVNSLAGMEYRQATATGTFDEGNDILLRNQVVNGLPGYRLLTPLRQDGSPTAILVDRGWISFADGQAFQASRYSEPGQVRVKGVLRQGQSQPGFGGVANPTLPPGQTRLVVWNYLDLGRIQVQTGYAILPAYLQEAADPAFSGQPVRSVEMPVLDEGPHMSYAIQWFLFATILGVGFPFIVRRSLRKQAVRHSSLQAD